MTVSLPLPLLCLHLCVSPYPPPSPLSLSISLLLYVSDSFCVLRACVPVCFFSVSASISLRVFLPFVSLPVFICVFFFSLSLSLYISVSIFLSLSFFCFCLSCPQFHILSLPSHHRPAHVGWGSLPSQFLTPGSHSKLPSPGLSCPPLLGLGGGGRRRKGGQPGGPTPFCLSRLGGWASGPFNQPGQAVPDTSPGRRAWFPWFWQPPAQPAQPAQPACNSSPHQGPWALQPSQPSPPTAT